MLFGTQFLEDVYADDTITSNAHLKALERYHNPNYVKDSERQGGSQEDGIKEGTNRLPCISPEIKKDSISNVFLKASKKFPKNTAQSQNRHQQELE